MRKSDNVFIQKKANKMLRLQKTFIVYKLNINYPDKHASFTMGIHNKLEYSSEVER